MNMNNDEQKPFTIEDHEQLKRDVKSIQEPKRVIVKGQIQDAVYHRDQGTIAVQLALPDGTRRAAYMHKSAYTFFGRHFSEVEAHEVDKQMEKTAELFRQARGRRIKLEISEDQARMD
jgi:hypothetical protein